MIKDEVERIAELLHDQIGLPVGSNLGGRLRRSVRDGAAARGLTIAAYADEVLARGVAWQDLLNRVTVQETAFFRHPEQFDVLTDVVLPAVREPVRIWSAGCANGQEAYTLAMLLDEHGIDGSVLATDVSTTALERTRSGQYAARELRGLSPTRIARHLTPVGREWRFNQSLRDRVTTARYNLLDPLPRQLGSVQVIFCRNVLIYVTAPNVRIFLDRLAAVTAPGSALFIGAAEVLWHPGAAFEPAQVGSTFYYRRTADVPLRTQPRAVASTGPTTPVSRTVDESGRAGLGAPVGAGRRIERRTRDRAAVLTGTGPAVRAGRAPRPAAEARAADVPPDADSAARAALAKTGEDATALGDHNAAVVAFRACTYLAPHDAIAHLHLGLALEAAGDRGAATRTFGVARRVLLALDPDVIELSSEGYAVGELLNLLDTKLR